MVLFIIGLGLADEKDITLKGLEAVKSCDHLYLEKYTSILMCSLDKVEELYGKKVIECDREFVESGCDEMIEQAKTMNIGFLVVGDPFCATTHSDMFLRCVEQGVKVEMINNASIMNAIGCTGLQVYRFGETVSLPFFTEKWRPYSYHEKIKQNKDRQLHTLVLLDIKVKEPTEKALLSGKMEYMPPRFMSTQTAAEQLLETEEQLGIGTYAPDSPCFALARIGASDQQIVSGPLKAFLDIDMGGPLHSFIICGEMHPIEEQMYKFYLAK